MLPSRSLSEPVAEARGASTSPAAWQQPSPAVKEGRWSILACVNTASRLTSWRLEGLLMTCACCWCIAHASMGLRQQPFIAACYTTTAVRLWAVLRAPAHVRPPDVRGTQGAAAHLGQAAAVTPAPLRPRRQAGGQRVRLLGHPRAAWPLQLALLALQARFACRQSGVHGPARHRRRHPGYVLFAQTWLLQR